MAGDSVGGVGKDGWMDDRDTDDLTYPPDVVQIAARHGLRVKDLDWHLETVHGWGAGRKGYREAVEQAALCMLDGGCEDGGQSGRWY
jgi:hypothetical protein